MKNDHLGIAHFQTHQCPTGVQHPIKSCSGLRSDLGHRMPSVPSQLKVPINTMGKNGKDLNWLVVYLPSETYDSQLGWFSQHMEEFQKVPNHQPVKNTVMMCDVQHCINPLSWSSRSVLALPQPHKEPQWWDPHSDIPTPFWCSKPKSYLSYEWEVTGEGAPILQGFLYITLSGIFIATSTWSKLTHSKLILAHQPLSEGNPTYAKRTEQAFLIGTTIYLQWWWHLQSALSKTENTTDQWAWRRHAIIRGFGSTSQYGAFLSQRSTLQIINFHPTSHHFFTSSWGI